MTDNTLFTLSECDVPKAMKICCLALCSNGYTISEFATMFRVSEDHAVRILREAAALKQKGEIKESDVINIPPDIRDHITGGY